MTQLVVVALDLNVHDNIDAYDGLSVRKKTRLLTEYISNTYEVLHKQHPEALCVFVWREYGITRLVSQESKSEEPTISRFIPVEDAIDFNMSMINLTAHNRDLIVIGSMAVTEIFDSQSYHTKKLPELIKAYEEHAILRHNESKSTREAEQQFDYHLKQLEKTKTGDYPQGITVVRNVCFGFQQGDKFEHCKTTPYYETKDQNGVALPDAVFEPGHGKTNHPIFDFVDPKTKQLVPIIVQLCREQDVANESMAQRVATLKTRPLLHLVLSYGANLRPDRIHGQYAIPVDGANRPKLLLTEPLTEAPAVMLYQLNLLEKKPRLTGPLQPLYPFEKQVLDMLDQALAQYPSKESISKPLKELRAVFIESSKSIDNTAMYACLTDFLQAQEQKAATHTGLFQPPLIPDKFIQQLRNLVVTAEKNHPVRKDYLDGNLPLMVKTTSLKPKL